MPLPPRCRSVSSLRELCRSLRELEASGASIDGMPLEEGQVCVADQEMAQCDEDEVMVS